MIIRGKEKWKEVIEAQKQSGLTIKKYCNDNPICISSFYKQKALILDEENIFMETSQGTLAIRGSSLHVCRLELEKGEAEIEGKVDSLIYTQGRKEKKKGSLLKRLFQ